MVTEACDVRVVKHAHVSHAVYLKRTFIGIGLQQLQYAYHIKWHILGRSHRPIDSVQ